MKLKFHSIRIKANVAAVYYEVRFEDENGKLYDGHASQFLFDLVPVPEREDVRSTVAAGPCGDGYYRDEDGSVSFS